MQKIFTCLLLAGLLAACSKDSNSDGEEKNGPIICWFGPNMEGKWLLYQQRADPGDGSGKWRPAETAATLEFKANGSFSDSRSNTYTKFEWYHPDSILLQSADKTKSYKLAIQQLTNDTLSYYMGWPWCGGPSGEKWVRKLPGTHN